MVGRSEAKECNIDSDSVNNSDWANPVNYSDICKYFFVNTFCLFFFFPMFYLILFNRAMQLIRLCLVSLIFEHLMSFVHLQNPIKNLMFIKKTNFMIAVDPKGLSSGPTANSLISLGNPRHTCAAIAIMPMFVSRIPTFPNPNFQK